MRDSFNSPLLVLTAAVAALAAYAASEVAARGHLGGAPTPSGATVVAALVVLGVALVASVVDRRERARSREAEALSRLAAIVESSGEAIYSGSLEGMILSWNQAAERLYGYRPDEIVGRPASLLFPPEREGELRDIIVRIGRGERIEHSETVRVRKDGARIDVALSVSSIRDSAGTIVGVSVIARDVGERRRAERALRASVERYRLAASATNDVVWDWDLATNEIVLSDSAIDALGHELSRNADGALVVNAYDWFDLVHPDDWGRVAKATEDVIHFSGQPWCEEYRVRVADGSYRAVIARGRVLRDERDEPVRMIGAIMDITERKRSEEAVRRSGLQLAAAQQIAQLGSWEIDLVRGKVTWSDELFRMFGLAPGEVTPSVAEYIGRVHPDDCRLVQDVGVRTMRELTPFAYEHRMVRRDGSVRIVSARGEVAVDADGGPIRVSGIAQDITERKQIEESLRAARAAAEEANRAKGEFLANMSHEIRTPMNGVMGMLELALDTDLSAEQREYVEVARSSADALLTVINDVLDFSKMEAGKLELQPAPFALRDALSDMVRTLAMRADQKGLELVLDIRPTVPAALVGDAGRLRQVVLNVVGNAIKFTERGEVVVTVDAAPCEPSPTGDVLVRFAVADSGIGIPVEKQQLIFEAFQQADSSTTRQYGGTGLGLSISSQLVAMMGGRIWVESEAGRGSTFHFTARFGRHEDRLPAQGASSAPRTATLAAALRGVPVLVVDDNATNRRILEQTLADWQMRPTLCDGGAAALDRLERARAAGTPFRLVLLDAHMPGMDGFRLADRIRARGELAGATVMMLSSGAQRGDVARCRALGVAAYLTKPVRSPDLLAAVATALEPGRQAEAAPAPAVRPHGIAPAGRALRILLAEDNAVNQRLAVALLERRGHSVLVAGNGRAALDALALHSFDLVLMDVQMPEMGGFEATVAIRERERESGGHVPIVAMTARAMAGDREQCLAVGMDDYLAKPIRPAELFEMVERLGGATPADAPERDPAAGRREAANRLDGGRDGLPAEVVDGAALRAMVGGDEGLMGEIIALFLGECPRMLDAVRVAVRRGERPAFQEAAHALRGSVGNLAAPRALAAARELEMLARAGDMARAESALAALERELGELEGALVELAAGV